MMDQRWVGPALDQAAYLCTPLRFKLESHDSTLKVGVEVGWHIAQGYFILCKTVASRLCLALWLHFEHKWRDRMSRHLTGHIYTTTCPTSPMKHRRINNLFLKAKRQALNNRGWEHLRRWVRGYYIGKDRSRTYEADNEWYNTLSCASGR